MHLKSRGSTLFSNTINDSVITNDKILFFLLNVLIRWHLKGIILNLALQVINKETLRFCPQSLCLCQQLKSVFLEHISG